MVRIKLSSMFISLIVFFTALSTGAAAQDSTLRGTVKDMAGTPLIGVNVIQKGTTNGTVTDVDGSFSIKVPAKAAVVFTYIGFSAQEVVWDGASAMNVVMQEDTELLDEVIVVGYGVQRKVSNTASVSSVNGEDLTSSPVANINNSIVGRVPGILSFQNSGEPGSDAASLRIRGIGTTGNANALLVIDGIPQNYNSLSKLNSDEIESISILKDAAAVAPYGIGGANGVILVTTKRGIEGKIGINYNGYYGVQQPTALPKFLDAYGYASKLNEANLNIGNKQTFTDEELLKFKNGTDPDHYPNTDWVNEIVNFQAPITKHSLSFSGGTEKIKFHSNLGYLYQEGIISQINYNRFSLLLNVDANVTKTTKISFDLNAGKETKSNPGNASGSGLFTDITEVPPIYPIRFSNGLPAHNMLPSITESGYGKNTDNNLNIRLLAEQKIPFIPGLIIKGVFGYNTKYSFDKTWRLPYTFYKLSANNEYVPQPSGPIKPSLSEGFNQNIHMITQFFVTYQKKLKNQEINFLGVYEGKSTNYNDLNASRVNYELFVDELSLGSSDKNNFDNSGNSSKSAQMGWVYRLDYSLFDKYLLQLSGRYDGHYYFAPEKRFAFFPSLAIGWRISEEKFIKNNYPWINNLKIRGSYGLSGNLAGSAFQYLTAYETRNSYVFGGINPYQVLGIYESVQANPDITWEKAKKGNIGIDALLLNGKIDVTFDLFTEKRSDMLINPATIVPAEYGIGLSQVNAGVMKNKGFDFSIALNHDFNDFNINFGVNLSHAKNELIETFETKATYNNPNRRETGRPLNTRFGLKSLGLYQLSDFDDQGNLKAGLPVPSFGKVQPGDIKYADIAGAPDENGNITAPDGKIDINDYTVIGDPLFPQLIFGFNTDLSWRGLYLNMLWQGAGEMSVYIDNELAAPFFNGAKIFEEQTDYWTPENPNATYPRLTPNPITHNTQPSSFWVKDGTYLRLKNIELGYHLPTKLINKTSIKSVRIYVTGQNLLSFSGLKFMDPELTSARGRYYYQQKVFAIGTSISF